MARGIITAHGRNDNQPWNTNIKRANSMKICLYRKYVLYILYILHIYYIYYIYIIYILVMLVIISWERFCSLKWKFPFRCQTCVDVLFTRPSAACPQCNTALRRSDFRVQQFEDPFVEKEVDIRRRIVKM